MNRLLLSPVDWGNLPFGKHDRGFIEYSILSDDDQDGPTSLTTNVVNLLNMAIREDKSVMSVGLRLPPVLTESEEFWQFTERFAQQMQWSRRESDEAQIGVLRQNGFDRFMIPIQGQKWFFTVTLFRKQSEVEAKHSPSFLLMISGLPLIPKRRFTPDLIRDHLLSFVIHVERSLTDFGMLYSG